MTLTLMQSIGHQWFPPHPFVLRQFHLVVQFEESLGIIGQRSRVTFVYFSCMFLECLCTFVFLNTCICCAHLQDSEAASCKMNSLGSNHSIPSTSVSTGSQSSSVNSMQEVLDDSCSDMTMMHPQDYSSTLDSSPHTKKVKIKGEDGMVIKAESWNHYREFLLFPKPFNWASAIILKQCKSDFFFKLNTI